MNEARSFELPRLLRLLEEGSAGSRVRPPHMDIGRGFGTQLLAHLSALVNARVLVWSILGRTLFDVFFVGVGGGGGVGPARERVYG